MKEKWRLLITDANTAAMNMAIDNAILISHSKGRVPPTVRFYMWKPPAVSIGYFQSLHDEVDVEACKRIGVDYVRRITGGGAVYHDKELTYSIVISESHPEIPSNIIESYQRICGALIRGFKHMNVKANFAPINDILVNGKKISGNAQTRRYNTVLQHGTILIDVDIETMFSLLKIPGEKIKDKMIKDAKERVISLSDILGRSLSFREIASNMRQGFEEEFNVELAKGSLTEEEINNARFFHEHYFASDEWNSKR
ncbi:MAG: biotin/lipoate A/B protein ligase family protein [Candidatus Thermoplasmatota archaeon]